MYVNINVCEHVAVLWYSGYESGSPFGCGVVGVNLALHSDVM